MRQPRVWRFAVAGNAAALLLLTFLFVQGPLLFTARASVARGVVTQPLCATPSTALPDRASSVLVIVIDALRLDRATDPHTMPTLTALAQQGNFSVSIVETLIPSTVAAIQALVAGVIVPPLAFVDDFAALAAEHGGILEAIGRCAGRTFVAGPRLWTDLYGRWISEAVTTTGFVEDDERLLTATKTALGQKIYQLVVIHFSRPDHAAHQYGAHSAEYRRALQWSDSAIAQLIPHVDDTTAIVVTADHGATRQGGHAGLEPAVRLTPLITWGPGVSSQPATTSQAQIPLLLRAALQPAAAVATVSPSPALPSTIRVVLLLLLALAVLSIQRILGSLHLDARTAPDALLNATVWVTLILGFYGAWPLALGLSVVIVCVLAQRVPLVQKPQLLLALGVGCLFGGLRLIDGLVTSGHESPTTAMAHIMPWSAAALISAPFLAVGSGVTALQFRQLLPRTQPQTPRLKLWSLLLSVVLIAYGVAGITLAVIMVVTACVALLLGRGLLLPQRYAPGMVGIIAACLPAASARLSGETVSLSTIDVQVAFTVANSSLGLPGTITVAMIRQALPSVCVGISVGWALRHTTPTQQGRFAAGLATAYVAQALLAVIVMFAGDLVDPALVSLALGSVLHILNEVTFSFLTLAGVVYLHPVNSVQQRRVAAATAKAIP
jgi:hypothetical protein